MGSILSIILKNQNDDDIKLNKIKLNSVKKIENWYLKYKFPYNEDQELPINMSKKNLIRFYKLYYKSEYLLKLPEFAINKLKRTDLNCKLPKIENRTKRDVLNFMNILSIEDIEYIGL